MWYIALLFQPSIHLPYMQSKWVNDCNDALIFHKEPDLYSKQSCHAMQYEYILNIYIFLNCN